MMSGSLCHAMVPARPTPRGGLVICLVAAALLSGAARPAVAQGWISELRAGLLAHDAPIIGQQKEHGVDINGEVLFTTPVAGGFADHWPVSVRWLAYPRPHFGFSANTAGFTSQIYTGLTWTAKLFDDVVVPHDSFLLSFGIGPAFNTGDVSTARGDRKSLGSHVLIHAYLEATYRFSSSHSVSVYYEHSSNAGLADRNEGLNNLGLRFGVAF